MNPTEKPFPRTNPRLLFFGAPVLVLLTIAAAPLLGRALGSLPALLCLWGLYVLGAWGCVLVTGPRRELRALYETPMNRRPVEIVLTWVPVMATFGLVFLDAAPRLGLPVLVAIGAVALVNGFTEELFWRGTFVATFPDSLWAAYLYPAFWFAYPAFWFAAWHLSLALVPGVDYEGGAAALVGGSAFMGLRCGRGLPGRLGRTAGEPDHPGPGLAAGFVCAGLGLFRHPENRGPDRDSGGGGRFEG